MGKKIKLFLVEDDILYQKNLTKKLEGLNIDIQCFSSGDDCINNLESLEKPDIIVLDLHLSSEKNKSFNGLKVLKEAKYIDPDIYVIILTANDSLDTAVESIKEGAFDYIVKSETAFVRLEAKIKSVINVIELKQTLSKSQLKTNLSTGLIILSILTYFIIKLFFR